MPTQNGSKFNGGLKSFATVLAIVVTMATAIYAVARIDLKSDTHDKEIALIQEELSENYVTKELHNTQLDAIEKALEGIKTQQEKTNDLILELHGVKK